MKIQPVAAELLHADGRAGGRTDRHTNDESDSRFSQFCEKRLKIKERDLRGQVSKYPHWCFNVLWVGGTAFCARMLTDSTFVSVCGKFQHHHTV